MKPDKDKEIFKRIVKKIKAYDTIVIARHVGPDPDAVCSQVALRDSIRETYKNKKVYAVGHNVSRFRVYGSMDHVDVTKLKNALLITTDVPNYNRIDGVTDFTPSEIIKIDHHPFEEDFGGIECIDDTASSASQLVADLILKTNLKLTDSVAKNLYCGIISDSDRFLLLTTINTFKTVTQLLERSKIDFIPLYRNLYERPANEFKFHGYLGSNLTITDNGLAYIIISPEILKEYGVDTATPSNMINDFNFIKDVSSWVFITYDEKNEIYKVNIRSRGPIINEVAAKYNGGGHKFASGARFKEAEKIEEIIADLDAVCAAYKEEK